MRDFYEPGNDDFDEPELLVERQARKAYERKLMRHPDPRDPDHPGVFGEDD
jgi:hypothetical protein